MSCVLQPIHLRDVNVYHTGVQTVVGLMSKNVLLLNLLFSFGEIYKPDILSLLLIVINFEVNLLAKSLSLVSERQINVLSINKRRAYTRLEIKSRNS